MLPEPSNRPATDPTRARVRAWVAAIVLAVCALALVWFGLPHTNEPILWIFVVKLAAFFVVSLAACLFPWRGGRLALGLVTGAFLVFAGYLFPRISYFYYVDAGRQPDSFYTTLYLLTYPAVVMTAALTYRLAGGTSGQSLKVAWTGILVLFSGYLDVMWQLVNPVVIPATLTPTHIVAIVGRPVTFAEIIWFTVAHVPLVALLWWAPIDRWLDRWLGPDPALGGR